ncbi:AAA family ATPase [Enterococcus sp. BWM-S5]|uniref:AAA family ATPase n=1 Tax=Enterococcus larvae TaxID=2794352 RepID=A0ABS4CFG5_9ENTE|nr:AAA family ATPase [Enterococcus larvae]MBP1044876.1 AAA family ATPase [Enterococcus larvae]
MSSIKINKLEIENVKRVKAVKIEPSASGLTIVGGNNNQGKTSVLDAIAWALGGNKHRPSEPHREGSAVPPHLHIVMSNGLVVERHGKNSDLKVLDPEGNKGGQQLLNSFVEELAIDLPKFMESTGKEKAQTLLQIIGVGDQLAKIEYEEQQIYNQRHAIGQIADQKDKFAKEQDYYPDAPKELVSVSELIQQQQQVLARNGENQQKRLQLTQIEDRFRQEEVNIDLLNKQINDMQIKLAEAKTAHEKTRSDLVVAEQSATSLQDESTAELEKNIAEIDEINRKVRTNLDKDKAEEDAAQYREQYDMLSGQIEELRKQKIELLNKADLPLPGLSVTEGELIYNGQRWDNMSGSDQLKVSTAIVRKLKPQCGFILLDKLEQMDMPTLNEFGQWLEQEGLQAIATRVSTGEECSIIIEDGYVAGETPQHNNTTWEEGKF